MRIAIVHSYYSSESSSGENQIVDSQAEMLRKNGHELLLISTSSNEILRSKLDLIYAGLRVATGVGRNPLRHLHSFKPDITIVHNLHPNYGSRWMAAWDGPIIRVLHNYRLYCASATFFRNGHPCLDCIEISPFQGLKNSCYKDSRVATLPLILAQARRIVSPVETNSVDIFIALSEVSKSILIDSKLPETKIRVLPNFIKDPYKRHPLKTDKGNGRWISVGRLSKEKGFSELIEAWPAKHKLDIVGHGPLFSDIAHLVEKKPNIRLLGKLDNPKLLSLLPNYTGAVFPSLCFEVAPIVAIEFLSAGLPLITTRVSSVSSLVKHSHSGIVLDQIKPGELKDGIQQVLKKHREFSINARRFFEENFTAEIWGEKIDRLLYEIANKQKSSQLHN